MKSFGTKILDASQNPTGRTLVQVDNRLYVLSECCMAQIDALYGTIGKVYMKCGDCGNILAENPNLWNTQVVNLNESYNSETESWKEWGMYIFGLQDFGMRITE